MPAHPSWSPEFLALLGTFDEEIERMPQQPITSLKNPFEGFEPTDEDVARFEAWMAEWKAKRPTR